MEARARGPNERNIGTMADFDGKVALVTGGGAGIGRAAAVAFARAGARVVIGNRNTELGEDAVRAIRDGGGEASFLRTDVTVASDVETLVEHAVRTFGGLDVAFNNAGVEGELAPVTEQTESNYDAVMNVNVRGVWLSMKYEIPRMLERGGGAIVNCSSVAGLIGFPGAAIYCASKHAVNGLTRTAALEWSAQGVRVNAVNPAVIHTSMADRLSDKTELSMDALAEMHPIGRVGQADEVAGAVVWLCSDAASFVTGHTLAVDGGYTAQ